MDDSGKKLDSQEGRISIQGGPGGGKENGSDEHTWGKILAPRSGVKQERISKEKDERKGIRKITEKKKSLGGNL